MVSLTSVITFSILNPKKFILGTEMNNQMFEVSNPRFYSKSGPKRRLLLAPAPQALPPDWALRAWLPSPKMAAGPSGRGRHLEPGRAGGNGVREAAAIFPRALPEAEAAISEEGSSALTPN